MDTIVQTPLCQLAIKYGSDKVAQLGKHTYTPYYYDLFNNQKRDIRKVLEIGIGEGASLRMWQDFFPNAKIYGVDYRQNALINEHRIESILGDQRNREQLVDLVKKTGNDIDLVIDDGSHRPPDQVFTCTVLMPLLKKSVTYVIEDVADLNIVERLSGYYLELPELDQSVKRFDNRLVIVRHKPA